MKKIAILLVFALFLTSCSTSKSVAKRIDRTLQESPVMHQSFSGLVVFDPEEAKILYSHNGDKYFTPASNTKLFTFYTGLKILGDSVPGLNYTVKGDSLIFWGTGDPSLFYEPLPESEIFEFLNSRKENLYYALPNYSEDHFGPGWAWDDYNYSYSVEKGDLPLYGNFVRIHFSEQESVPNISPAYFSSSLIPADPESSGSSRAIRDLSKNRFVYNHSPGKAKVQKIPFKYTPELIAALLSDTLQKKVELLKETPAYLKPERTIFSIPTDSLYKRMLQESDNFIAEQILLMAAGKISDTLKSDIAIKFMMENHLRDLPDDPQWVDGSGLSRYNLFTPRSVVKLLEKIRKEMPADRLFQLFPAGGESGTLKNFYKASSPYVFAKTGTLSNNHSLSGFLKTRSGKHLIFSFMNSNFTVPSSAIKAEMEKILLSLRDNF